MLAGSVSRRWWRDLRFNVGGDRTRARCRGRAGLGGPRARIQREAVAAIKSAGGHVDYDGESGAARPFRAEDMAPRWLVDLLGVDYFGHVTDVWLPTTPDGAIAKVACLTRLERSESRSTVFRDSVWRVSRG